MNKLIPGAAALALGVGVLALGVASPASAHTGGLAVSAACNTSTGEYDFAATLTVDRTDLPAETMWRVGNADFEATPATPAGLDRGPVSTSGKETVKLGSWSVPGTTTGKGPWLYAFTTWEDDYTQGSDGQLLEDLAGDCGKLVPALVPTTARVEVAPPTCTDLDGSFTLAYTHASVTAASIDGAPVPAAGFSAGTHASPLAGVHRLTLTPASGYVFTDGSDALTFTVAAPKTAQQCAPPTPPVTPEPTPEPTIHPTPTASATPFLPVADSATPAHGLAATGGDTAKLTVAALLGGLGVVSGIVLMARRRRA